jgi:hypothetical protein
MYKIPAFFCRKIPPLFVTLTSHIDGLLEVTSIDEIWRSWVIMDRLNTKELMQRKNWQVQDGVFCVLCSQHAEESRDHLIFSLSICCQLLG